MKRNQKSQRRRDSSQNKNSSIFASKPLQVEYMLGYFKALIFDAKCALQGHYSNADATLDYIRIKNRIRSEGSGFATLTMPSLMNDFLNYLETGQASFPQFRKKRGTEYPAFFGRLFHLVCQRNDTTSRVAFDYLYSILYSFKKLRGTYQTRTIRKLFADFCKVDVELGEIDFFSKELRPVLDDARHQWRIFVAESNLARLIEESTPQPGPGATNSPLKKHMRYRPHVLYKQIDEVMPYREWFYPTPYDIFTSETAFNGFYNYTVESPTARFKAVPKTAGKPRGICIEENEMQTMQQAIRKAFYKAISVYFGRNIAITDQSVNANLALESSVTRDKATIDESEASDRVARLLVSYLSQDNTKIHDLLMGLSTRYVIPPKEVEGEYAGPVGTNKYAPMGSALCFPVMSLVHMFLIRAIIRCSTPQNVTHDINSVYVYGDDIILPSKYAELIYAELPKFGMKLNKTKSFYRSFFRESCGIHAYKGKDVTPVYVKYIPFHGSAEAKISALAVEELLHKKGFETTAKFQRDFMMVQYGNIPFVPSGLSFAGFQRTSINAIEEFKQLRRRKWNRRYQCATYTVPYISKVIDHLNFENDLDAYTRWMWTAAQGSNKPLKTVGDSRDRLFESTRTVLESAIGSSYVSDEIDNLIKRYPTVSRYTHPSWFGRLQRNKSAVGCRCYL